MATISKTPVPWEQGWEQPSLQPVLDALPFSAAVVNSAGAVCSVNRLWLAVPEPVLPGQGYREFCQSMSATHADVSEALAVGIRDVLSGRQTRFSFDGPAGRRIVVTPYRDQAFEGALILCQEAGDDRHRSQSEKMETLGRLLAGVTHDFANLITLITAYSEILLGRIGSQDPLREELEQIRQAAERGARLTAQLLDVARNRPRQPSLLDLNTLIGEVVRMLHSVIGENIRLETRLSPDLGRVRIEPGQMERVFLNLVLNARDAMPGGGKITVETANREAPGPAVQITITDTGDGIDAETMAHLFEPLFTTKGNGRGTGLGLCTVRGIVRQNGGEVQARSNPGHGTTFTVWLPQATPASGISDAATPESLRPDAGSETILLVEDEGNVRRLFAHVLRERGYKVVEAAHAEEALDLFARHQGGIDLLCTDLVMPGISGRELAERIRLRQPDLRVVYMSGYNTDALLGMGMLAPGGSYLQKPLRPAALAAEVRGALDRPLRGAAAAG